MKFGSNKILGLAIGERLILVAEVLAGDDERQVTRSGEFVYPDGVSLTNAEGIGNALGVFLKSEGFTAKAAVFGIPAKWVLTKSKEVPPVDPSLAADLLRLGVESEFSAELKDFVYDYAGQTEANAASHILLAATPKGHIEQIETIAKASHLDVKGIAPTSVVLSIATGGASDALVLSITPSGTELAAQRGANPSLLRHIGSSQSVTSAVAGEVRRASLMMPRNGTSGNGSTNGHSHGQVVVWDDAGLDAESRRTVTDALGPIARNGDFTTLGAGRMPDGVRAYAASASLAVAGIAEGALPIDFLHSRLAPPKKAAIPRQTILAIAAGVVLVIGIIWAYVDLHQKEAYLEHLKTQISDDSSKVDAAKKEVDRIRFSEGWRNVKPRYVACWADLASALPPSTDTIVATMTLDDNMKGEIHGRARTKDAAEMLFKRLNGSPHFKDVNADRDKGNNNPDTKTAYPISFTINFTYKPG